MATVWLAQHTLLEREVAIKIIRPELVTSEGVRARFRGEARAAGRIDHPNVCEILDFGVGPLGPFIVMERLDGLNLGQVLRRVGRLRPGQLLSVLRPALKGIAAAHARGIIHRDLKPENVFLHRLGTVDLIVKLTDFGIAKFTDGTGEVETEQGAVIGTPHYMAPEQFSTARQLGAATDVWSLGVILYRGLSGREPFKDETLAATLVRVIQKPTPRLETVPAALQAIVERCLAKQPGDRFPDIASLSAALEAAGIVDEALPPLEPEPVPPLAGAFPPPMDPAEIGERLGAFPEELPIPAKSSRLSVIVEPEPRTPWLRWGAVVGVGAGVAVAVGFVGIRDIAPVEASAVLYADVIGPPDGLPSEPTELPERSVPPSEHTIDREMVADPTRTRSEEVSHPTANSDPTGSNLAAVQRIEAEIAIDEPKVEPTPSEPTPSEPGTATEVVPALPIEAVADTVAKADEEPAPAPLVRWRNHVGFTAFGPLTTQYEARKYCEGLADRREQGYENWKLANPSVAQRIAETGALGRARYWTSARWHGRVLVLRVPDGTLLSRDARSKIARPLCVALTPLEELEEDPIQVEVLEPEAED